MSASTPGSRPLAWEAWTEDGWQPCEVDRDGTGGLNRPGDIVLHIPGGHVLSRNGGHEAGWIRCRVTEPLPGQPFLTTSPTIHSAEAYTIGGTTGTVHAETVHDEALGESTGLPGQRLRLEHAPVVADDPPVLLQTAAGTAGRTGRSSRTSRAPAPTTTTSPSTPPPARSPSAPPSANPTAPCASTAPSPQRAPSSAPAATAPAAAGPATWPAASRK